MSIGSPDDFAWMKSAKCGMYGADWDFLELRLREGVCRTCPVQVECREFESRFETGTRQLIVGGRCRNGHKIRTARDIYVRPGRKSRTCQLCRQESADKLKAERKSRKSEKRSEKRSE